MIWLLLLATAVVVLVIAVEHALRKGASPSVPSVLDGVYYGTMLAALLTFAFGTLWLGLVFLAVAFSVTSWQRFGKRRRGR